MHHWNVGGDIYIGWPDHGVEERRYTIVDLDLFGKVFRARVTDGARQGGFMVIFDCPNIIMEQLAEQASHALASASSCPASAPASRAPWCAASTTNGIPRRSTRSVPTRWRRPWPAFTTKSRRGRPARLTAARYIRMPHSGCRNVGANAGFSSRRDTGPPRCHRGPYPPYSSKPRRRRQMRSDGALTAARGEPSGGSNAAPVPEGCAGWWAGRKSSMYGSAACIPRVSGW